MSLSLPPKAEATTGYSQVIAQGQQLSTLILQLIDELRVVPILPHQRFLERNKKKDCQRRQRKVQKGRDQAELPLKQEGRGWRSTPTPQR